MPGVDLVNKPLEVYMTHGIRGSTGFGMETIGKSAIGQDHREMKKADKVGMEGMT